VRNLVKLWRFTSTNVYVDGKLVAKGNHTKFVGAVGSDVVKL
jgi:hypothetical protein